MTTPNTSYPPASPAKAGLNNLPERLKREGKYCYWKYQARPGGAKPAKVPQDPKTGKPANTADASTFGCYADVQDYAGKGCDGVGVGLFPLPDGSVLGAIDIDHCIDAQGKPSAMADDIIRTMDAYTESSPSGQGIRILLLLPPGYAFNSTRYYINNQALGLEVYVAGATNKYVSVTGNTWTPGVDLELRDQELSQVLEKYMVRPDRLVFQPAQPAAPVRVQQVNEPRPEDLALIESIKNSPSGEKFMALTGGDISCCDNDHSKADMTFCNILAARTQDPAQIDRIVRSSGLMREKWDRPTGNGTYGSMTVQKAIGSALAYRQRLEQQKNAAPAAPLPPMAAPVQLMVPQQPPTVAIQQAVSQQVVSPTAAPTQQSAAVSPKPKFQPLLSAQTLSTMLFAPLVYLVAGLLAQGLTILSSAPKLGKSFLCLQLCLALTAGEPFLGRRTERMGVIYMALEDGPRRLQDRMSAILRGKPVPPNLYFITETYQTDNGLYQAIDYYLAQDPSIKLVIIDTFQKVRSAGAMQGKYLYDSREVSGLKQYADNRDISILLVHHTRKASGEGDAHAKISGTQGLFGSCDTSIVLDKVRRNDDQATLHITGRDVRQQDLAIRFDCATSRWEALGDASDVARQDYGNNETVKTIRILLAQSPDGHWQGKVSELMSIGKSMGYILANSPQGLGKELNRLEADLFAYDGIRHNTTKANGNGNLIHHFYARISASPAAREDGAIEQPETAAEAMGAEATTECSNEYFDDSECYEDSPDEGWDGTDDDIEEEELDYLS